MADGIIVRVDGLEEVERKLKQLPDRLGKWVKERGL